MHFAVCMMSHITIPIVVLILGFTISRPIHFTVAVYECFCVAGWLVGESAGWDVVFLEAG